MEFGWEGADFTCAGALEWPACNTTWSRFMQPIFALGNSRALQRLKALRQEAQTDSATRVVLRLQAIMLSVQGMTTGQIAQGLQVDRTRVHAWIGAWNEH